MHSVEHNTDRSPIPGGGRSLGEAGRRGGAGLSGRAATLNPPPSPRERPGRPGEAEPLLRKAVALDPGFAYAQYNLGWSLLEQGKAREALGPLRRTAAQQPDRWE